MIVETRKEVARTINTGRTLLSFQKLLINDAGERSNGFTKHLGLPCLVQEVEEQRELAKISELLEKKIRQTIMKKIFAQFIRSVLHELMTEKAFVNRLTFNIESIA